MLMIAFYLRELSLELLERAEALVRIVRAQIDNASGFWLPSDNPNGDAALVPEPAVEISHKAFALR